MLFRKSICMYISLCLNLSCFAGGFINLLLKVPQASPAASASSVPIVYHPSYDVTMGGLERVHPFDSAKYSKVFNLLRTNLDLTEADFHKPANMISERELLKVHTQEYLNSLSWSRTVAKISEIPILGWVPNFLLQRCLLNPMRYATAGTVLATELALKHGWAINLSGGYHHAKSNSGGGFCVYGDIQLAAKKVLEQHPDWRILIVDLDAHQGNGHEEGLMDEARAYIFDMYRQHNYPNDTKCKKRINYDIPLDASNDQEYLDILKTRLPDAIAQAQPQLIIYNAGTDIYERDRLGKMNISAEGIKERDKFVFETAEQSEIPVVMLLSGGYTPESAGIIASSITDIVKAKQR